MEDPLTCELFMTYIARAREYGKECELEGYRHLPERKHQGTVHVVLWPYFLRTLIYIDLHEE